MNTRHRADGSIRIIGGTWRGRKLSVAPSARLRPSSDRVRETVFNWLSPYLPGAVCLDLFAGTGALGFEAVSRGAASATLIENDALTIEYLHRHCAKLSAINVSVVEANALNWLRAKTPIPFDVVFLDPPFETTLLIDALEMIVHGWLNNRALVYLEAAKIPILTLQALGWRVFRQGHTRQMEFALIVRAESEEARFEGQTP